MLKVDSRFKVLHVYLHTYSAPAQTPCSVQAKLGAVAVSASPGSLPPRKLSAHLNLQREHVCWSLPLLSGQGTAWRWAEPDSWVPVHAELMVSDKSLGAAPLMPPHKLVQSHSVQPGTKFLPPFLPSHSIISCWELNVGSIQAKSIGRGVCQSVAA